MRKWFDIITGVVGVLGTFSGFVMCFSVALIGQENVSDQNKTWVTNYLLISMATFIVFAAHRLVTRYPETRSE